MGGILVAVYGLRLVLGAIVGLEGHEIFGGLCEGLLAPGSGQGQGVCDGAPSVEDAAEVDGREKAVEGDRL